MRHIVARITLVLVLSCSPLAHLQAAQNSPVELSADTIQYDSTQEIIIANGNVNMIQEKSAMTGSHAEYNSKTKEAYVTGGVRVVKDDAILLAAEVRSYDNTHMVATGSPVLTQGESELTGPQIDYYTDKQYAIVTGWAKLKTADSVMTANQIESFFTDNRAVAQGDVHIVSSARQMDATADQAVYYGSKGQDGKTVLTGNPRAVQEGNVLTGNVMTLYLDKKNIDVQGRSKLVIIPQ